MSHHEAATRWNAVAKSAYLAYGRATGGRNFRGEPMPDFEDLPRAIRDAWVAAAKDVAASAVARTMPGPGRE